MKRKNIIVVVVLVLIAAGVYAYFNFGQLMDLGMKMTSGMKHRDPASEKAAFIVTAEAFSKEFASNREAANTKYLDKTVLLEGNITDVQPGTVSLGNIVCTLDSAQAAKTEALKAGEPIKIQGLFVGYNELMEELDLSNCGVK